MEPKLCCTLNAHIRCHWCRNTWCSPCWHLNFLEPHGLEWPSALCPSHPELPDPLNLGKHGNHYTVDVVEPRFNLHYYYEWLDDLKDKASRRKCV